MGGDEHEDTSPRDEATEPGGPVDSDDTTQADAGMAAGTGSDEGQATVNPQGTEGHHTEADED